MIRKQVNDIVMEYVKNIVIINECPDCLHKLTTLVSFIKERGDEKACKELKYHCSSSLIKLYFYYICIYPAIISCIVFYCNNASSSFPFLNVNLLWNIPFI